MLDRNRRRIIDDAQNLTLFFDQVQLDDNLKWLIVYDVKLPYGFNVDKTAVLLKIPPDYPQTPPGVGHHGIYLTEGLLRFGAQPQSYLQRNAYCWKTCCDLSAKGWWWYCIKTLNGWDGTKHDFNAAIRLLQVSLQE
jgi:hypothetical protein